VHPFDYQVEKMNKIFYIDRLSGQTQVEKIYHESLLQLLYGDSKKNHYLRQLLLPVLTRSALMSRFYGYLQKRAASQRKIMPFIQKFDVDSSEFLEPVSSFHSFNDFFIRRLKSTVRPLAVGRSVAVFPADGRYLFYDKLSVHQQLSVKGKLFYLKELLQDEALAKDYANGTLVMGRLCPSDYHRFHFPCDCTLGPTHVINGYLQSVNPLAVKHNLETFSQNERTLCRLQTAAFGQVLDMEIGAFNVGSIQQTYQPEVLQVKGAEKGYFEFGGSAIILLFKENTIRLDQDLLEATAKGLEMRCLMGQRLGQTI